MLRIRMHTHQRMVRTIHLQIILLHHIWRRRLPEGHNWEQKVAIHYHHQLNLLLMRKKKSKKYIVSFCRDEGIVALDTDCDKNRGVIVMTDGKYLGFNSFDLFGSRFHSIYIKTFYYIMHMIKFTIIIIHQKFQKKETTWKKRTQ
jgi:hypothetical protein